MVALVFLIAILLAYRKLDKVFIISYGMKTKIIKQTIVFKASPKEVYDALMDSKKHSAFTGDTAKIGKKVGERFTAYSGYAEGKNVELMHGRKIVQSWRASDWEEGYYSQVTFLFEKTKEGTKMTFIQEGVPEEFYEDIKQGWIDYYWKPMKEMLEKEL